MKILLIFPGKVWGGAEQYVLDLGKSLAERGHQVRYMCRNSGKVLERLSNEDIVCKVLPQNGFLDSKLTAFLTDYLNEWKPDVIHIHHMNMVHAVTRANQKAQTNARILLTYHDCHRNSPWFWEKKSFKQLHKMIFVSQFAFNRWHGSNKWMPKELCKVVINSVKAADKSAPALNLRKKFNIAADTPILLFSGRVRKSKGAELILDALSTLTDLNWAMVFVGGYSPADYEKTLIAKCNQLAIADRVHFVGFTNNPQGCIDQCFLGLAPSIMLDPCPLSPFEFMQAAKCVISSDSGGQPEYIENLKTGIIVARNDAHALATQLRRMLENPEECRIIGEAARVSFSNTLSYDNFVDNIIDAYK